MAYIVLVALQATGNVDMPWWAWIVVTVMQLVVWALRLKVIGRDTQRLSRLESSVGLPDGSRGIKNAEPTDED